MFLSEFCTSGKSKDFRISEILILNSERHENFRLRHRASASLSMLVVEVIERATERP
jgi:hypothetical protein